MASKDKKHLTGINKEEVLAIKSPIPQPSRNGLQNLHAMLSLRATGLERENLTKS